MAHDCAQWDEDTHVSFVAERAWRLMLASLDDDDASQATTLAELNDCPTCLDGMVRYVVGAFAQFAEEMGGHDLAVQQTELQLARILDARRPM
jgi:predicted TPR repeat methyltransferase